MNQGLSKHSSQRQSWGRDLLLVVALGGLAWLGTRALGDPNLRAGLAWAIRSMLVPPDQDAGWQQRVGRIPRWRRGAARPTPAAPQHPEPRRAAHAAVGV